MLKITVDIRCGYDSLNQSRDQFVLYLQLNGYINYYGLLISLLSKYIDRHLYNASC
jgi:hypothetical protein